MGLQQIAYKYLVMLYYHLILLYIFFQLVFFQLGLVLCLFLELFDLTGRYMRRAGQ